MSQNPSGPSTAALRLSQVTDPHRVTLVCVGDSLTGYNNFGDDWPLPTYPDFLQGLLAGRSPAEVLVNGGQAGALSTVAPRLARQYLGLFPNANRFIIAFGTNDLGQIREADLESASASVLQNLAEAIALMRAADKQVLCFNVPQLNSDCFGKATTAMSRRMRAYHNAQLAEFCRVSGIPLADICVRLHNEHFADGLHPNEAGARLIAETLCAMID